MNYYQHHIGDYAAETAHLSLIEDAIYSRLLRAYYRDEKPLPRDTDRVAWMIGLSTRREKAALEILLDWFFVPQDDGWHHNQADEEIAKYQSNQGKAKAAAEKRWGKPEAEQAQQPGNAQSEAGNADAMPEQSPSNADAMPTQCQPLTNNHKPLTINQEPALTAPTPGVPPVVGRAQAHATPSHAPHVDNSEKTEGLAEQPIAEPKKTEPVSEVEPAKPDKPPKAGSKAERGSRLPDDWQLPKAWGDWALVEVDHLTDADVRREAAQFADYWHAKAGADARKADWEATWRTWIRKSEEFRRRQNRILPAARASPYPDVPDGVIPLVRTSTMQSAEIARKLIFPEASAA